LLETDVVGGGWINDARRLLAVDCLVQMAVKKGVLHVQLMDRPRAETTMLRTARMVAGLTTGLNVSS
jgi:hypothetical protein